MNDVPLALKYFLLAVELSDADPSDGNVAESVPEGVTIRAWYGVKSVCDSKEPIDIF